MKHANSEENNFDPMLCLDVPALLKTLPIKRSKLYMELGSGKLKARKLGTKTFVLRKDLENYLQSLPFGNYNGGVKSSVRAPKTK